MGTAANTYNPNPDPHRRAMGAVWDPYQTPGDRDYSYFGATNESSLTNASHTDSCVGGEWHSPHADMSRDGDGIAKANLFHAKERERVNHLLHTNPEYLDRLDPRLGSSVLPKP